MFSSPERHSALILLPIFVNNFAMDRPGPVEPLAVLTVKNDLRDVLSVQDLISLCCFQMSLYLPASS